METPYSGVTVAAALGAVPDANTRKEHRNCRLLSGPEFRVQVKSCHGDRYVNSDCEGLLFQVSISDRIAQSSSPERCPGYLSMFSWNFP